MQNVTLNNGVEMPILGFGVFQIPDDETKRPSTTPSRPATGHLDTAAVLRQRRSRRRSHQGQRDRPRGAVRHHQAVDPARPAGSVQDDTRRAFESPWSGSGWTTSTCT